MAEKQGVKEVKKRGEGRKFQKGQSGNPRGRPKLELSITTAIRKKLEDPAELDALATAIIREAKNGNSAAINAIMNRIDGPVPTEVNANFKREMDLSGISKEQLAAILPVLEQIESANGDDPNSG